MIYMYNMSSYDRVDNFNHLLYSKKEVYRDKKGYRTTNVV